MRFQKRIVFNVIFWLKVKVCKTSLISNVTKPMKAVVVVVFIVVKVWNTKQFTWQTKHRIN